MQSYTVMEYKKKNNRQIDNTDIVQTGSCLHADIYEIENGHDDSNILSCPIHLWGGWVFHYNNCL